MPIDPLLVNGITPVISPVVAAGQAQSIRDMMLQNAIADQQLQQQQFAFQQAQLQAQKNAQAVANYKASLAGIYGTQPGTQPGMQPQGAPVAPSVPDGTTAAGQRPTLMGGAPQGNLISSDASVPAAAGGYDDPVNPQQAPQSTPQGNPPPAAAPAPAAIPVGKSGAPIALPVNGSLSPADLLALAADAHAKAGNLDQARDLWKQSADVREKQAEAQKFQSEAQKNALESAEKQHAFVAQGLQAVINAPPGLKQETYDRVVAEAVSKGYAAPSDFEKSVPNDDQLKAFEQRMANIGDQIAQAKEAREAQAQSAEQKRLEALLPSQVADARAKATQATLAAVAPQLAVANNQGEWDAIREQIPDPLVKAQFPATWSAAARAKAQQTGMTAQEQVQTRQTAERDENTAANEKARTGIEAGRLKVEQDRQADSHNMLSGAMEPDVLDTKAKMLISGIPLTQIVIARGNAGVAQANQIIAAAKQINPNLDVASAMSNYKAESASNVKMTETLNALNAFEDGAGRNLDLALQQFSKLNDTGLKFLNTPIRSINAKMIGDPDQRAAMTALLAASRETARVVNNFGAKGELTDSARHAMDKLASDPNMTLGEFKAYASTIRQDMNNVRQAYQTGRDQVRSNIAGKPAAPAAAPAGKSSAYKVGDSVMYQGKPHKITAIKDNGKLVLEN